MLLLLAACTLGKPRAVVIKWQVESEQNTAGYNLLRADSEQGAFTKINPTLIPQAGDPLQAKTYEYTDESVVCGQTYWYKLQEVETTGAITTLEDKTTSVTACQ